MGPLAFDRRDLGVSLGLLGSAAFAFATSLLFPVALALVLGGSSAQRLAYAVLAVALWTAIVLRAGLSDAVVERFTELNLRPREPTAGEAELLARAWERATGELAAAAEVRLRTSGLEIENAFAVGRRTVIVTAAVLRRPREQLVAILAHEAGHLRLGHTRWLTLAAAALMPFSLTAARLPDARPPSRAVRALTAPPRALWALVTLLAYPAFLAVRSVQRGCELAADRHAVELGRGAGLRAYLRSSPEEPRRDRVGGVWPLPHVHPEPGRRLARIEAQ